MQLEGKTGRERGPGILRVPESRKVPLTDLHLRQLPPLRPTQHVVPTGRVQEFRLTAAPQRWELVKEVWVEAWSFNGEVPGPTIRVTEGDTVRVTVENHLPVPTSVHWHGLHVPNAVDGVPPMTGHGIAPGQVQAYEFVANHAGTFMYHSHLDEIEQVDRGLYGAFIIDPQDATDQPAYDHDLVMVLSGWTVQESAGDGSPRPGGHPAAAHAGHGDGTEVAPGDGAPAHGGRPGGHRHDYNYWTINGKSFPDVPPIKVRYGDWVRLRLINISQDMHPMHLHGHDFRVIAMDGHPLPQPLILNTVNVAPGQTVDIDFTANNPGRWLLHCHILHHASNNMKAPGGLTAVVEYEDSLGTSGHGAH